MPSTHEKIASVLSNNYLGDYADIMAISVSITHYYPQQADSQIRNAMTHLSRAANIQAEADQASVAVDEGAVDEQLNKAIDHIQRAKRDCLKLAIIEKKRSVIDHMKSISFAKGGLSEDIAAMRLEAEAKQANAFVQEAKGEKISEELEAVLTLLMKIDEELIRFNKVAFQPSKTVYYASKLIYWFKRASVLVTVAVLAYAIKVIIHHI